MSWPRFGFITSRTGLVTARLRELFREQPSGVFSLDLLISATQADTVEQVVDGIDRLISEGLVERVIKVVSPATGIGIEPYYASVVDVPKRLLDTTTGEEIEVDLAHVKQVFRHS